MNASMLQRCVNELQNKEPKIQYVIGVLETLIEMSATPDDLYLKANGSVNVKAVSLSKETKAVFAEQQDEAHILEKSMLANMKEIQALSPEQ